MTFLAKLSNMQKGITTIELLVVIAIVLIGGLALVVTVLDSIAIGKGGEEAKEVCQRYSTAALTNVPAGCIKYFK